MDPMLSGSFSHRRERISLDLQRISDFCLSSALKLADHRLSNSALVNGSMEACGRWFSSVVNDDKNSTVSFPCRGIGGVNEVGEMVSHKIEPQILRRYQSRLS